MMGKIDPQRRHVVKNIIPSKKINAVSQKAINVFFYVHILLSFHDDVLNSSGYVY